MTRRSQRRHSRPPKPWTEEQRARVAAWDKNLRRDERIPIDPHGVGKLLDSLTTDGTTVMEDLAAFILGDDAPKWRDRERFGQSDLPRHNRYSIPEPLDPEAVECPYCVKRPRNLRAHCRAQHPDKPEAH